METELGYEGISPEKAAVAFGHKAPGCEINMVWLKRKQEFPGTPFWLCHGHHCCDFLKNCFCFLDK